MRYYELTIRDSKGLPVELIGGQTLDFTSLNTGPTFFPSLGQSTNPSALHIEFDIPSISYDLPYVNSYIKIYGIPITAISQGVNLNNGFVSLRAGMWKGLPLAQPKQNGLVLTGSILQAFGNWQDTNQTLEFYVSPTFMQYNTPFNFSGSITKGVNLRDSIISTIKTAFKTINISPNVNTAIRPDLVATETVSVTYPNLQSYNSWINNVSRSIINNPDYGGVKIISYGDFTKPSFFAYDTDTYQPAPKPIEFTDFIGQPTWLEPQIITFKTVLRADIQVGDIITLPSGTSDYQITTQQSYSQYRNKTVFNGNFFVLSMRHMGSFRDKNADSWVTQFQASPINEMAKNINI